jgi:hypothetical protein
MVLRDRSGAQVSKRGVSDFNLVLADKKAVICLLCQPLLTPLDGSQVMLVRAQGGLPFAKGQLSPKHKEVPVPKKGGKYRLILVLECNDEGG